jgi:hypothetical protein
MNYFAEVLNNSAGIASGISNAFFSIFRDGEIFSTSLTGAALAFAAIVTVAGSIPEGALAAVRRWHGSIDEQLSNIVKVVGVLNEHKTEWSVPDELIDPLTDNCTRLCDLIARCKTTSASTDDRARRNTLLKSTVAYCLMNVKVWVYQAYVAGTLTVDDVHSLCFLLPGENGGHRDRSKATNIVAEVKVRIVTQDLIRVVIDQASGQDAGPVIHGWPAGVRMALIVIISAEDGAEIYRQMTSNLHNDIAMPENSRGKQFTIKASFMKHFEDVPRFGNEPTFSMPLTTEELIAEHDRRHHEDFEEQLRAVEQHRREVEGLKVEKN